MVQVNGQTILQYININSMCQNSILNPTTGDPIDENELSKILPRSIAQLELTRDLMIDIPDPVLEIYARFRPTAIKRARALENAIGTSCAIYYKDEGTTPSGTHKANSAYLIAYLCARDGYHTIATETTGNWGLALSLACKEFGLSCICFVDEVSARERHDLIVDLRHSGAEVRIVNCDGAKTDYLTMTANAAIDYTRGRLGVTYIFGSIFSYFIIPQSVIGLEAKDQLQELGCYPDVVIGSCGGGANFLGISAAFLLDQINGYSNPHFVVAESEDAPLVSCGECDTFFVDELGYYPPIQTKGLRAMNESEIYIGGLGSRVVASAVTEFYSKGMLETTTLGAVEAIAAARLFHETERMWMALESSYAVAAAIREARRRDNECLLLNISAGAGDQHLFKVA
jgi:tryptophan synthase beta chain